MIIDISSSPKKKLASLVEFLYHRTEFSYAFTLDENNSRTKYFNRKNEYYHSRLIDPDDPNIVYSEEMAFYEDPKELTEEIFYEIIYDANKPTDQTSMFYHRSNLHLTDEEYQILTNNSIESIFISCDRPIVFKSDMCGSWYWDSKGKNCTEILLKHYPKYKIWPTNQKICLKDFIDALYRIKSHKFDSWYELFNGTGITIRSDKIVINVIFDHDLI